MEGDRRASEHFSSGVAEEGEEEGSGHPSKQIQFDGKGAASGSRARRGGKHPPGHGARQTRAGRGSQRAPNNTLSG